jgi:hypothetical protein
MNDMMLELYERLKEMSKAYDVTIVTTPRGWVQPVELAFMTAKPKADATIVKFEQLKVRESAEYMTNILRFDPHAGNQSS